MKKYAVAVSDERYKDRVILGFVGTEALDQQGFEGRCATIEQLKINKPTGRK